MSEENCNCLDSVDSCHREKLKVVVGGGAKDNDVVGSEEVTIVLVGIFLLVR